MVEDFSANGRGLCLGVRHGVEGPTFNATLIASDASGLIGTVGSEDAFRVTDFFGSHADQIWT